MNITPVILAGGKGLRLWPLSTQQKPKQFVSLLSKQTLFINTLMRLKRLKNKFNKPLVVCSEKDKVFVSQQSSGKYSCNIMIEPISKGTAIAIGAAAAFSLKNDKDPILLILPADHTIKSLSNFSKSLNSAFKLAKRNKIVTLGVKADYANTNYGYIKRGSRIKYETSSYNVTGFVEKPSKKQAEELISLGNVFWNCGIFIAKASVISDLLRKYENKIFSACLKATNNIKIDSNIIQLKKKHFINLPSLSIDDLITKYEPVNLLQMVSLKAGWSDIGSWKTLWQESKKDKDQNLIKGKVLLKNTKNSYIQSTDKLVVVNNVNDLVIVNTKDSLFISEKDSSHKIKDIIGSLGEEKLEEAVETSLEYRPWGTYEILSEGKHYKTKKITVNPGEKLSLQSHRFRSEHWVVIKGKARVTKNQSQFELKKNETTFIEKGCKHSIENPNKGILEFIEIQTGDYFGEDDIKRYEDIYGRVED